MIRRSILAGSLGAFLGCATPGHVRRVETQVLVLRAETVRQDSVRAASLARIIRLQQQVLDSLTSTRQALRVMEAKTTNDVTDVMRQLLAVQEMVGQSQRNLSQLRGQLDARAEAQSGVPVAPAVPDTLARGPVGVPSASAEQMYNAALQQYRRGSVGTARRGFLDFLQQYPTHPNAVDAMYFVAETFETAAPDTAIVRFGEVRTKFPQSARAPAALYKIGYVFEQYLKDPARARAAYQRVVTEYPRSEDAELAKTRLEALKP